MGGGPGHVFAAALVPLSGGCSATVPLTPARRRTAPRTRPRPQRRSADAGVGRPPGHPHAEGEQPQPTFWLLFLSFWICGWSTNGLIGTHFIPAAHDHGMLPTTSAGLLALIGIFDIVGTVASGWLIDRVDSRYLLFAYYFLRGLSLLAVPGLLARPCTRACSCSSSSTASTGWRPCRRQSRCAASIRAREAGIVFGWVFAPHMVGAGIAAAYAGRVRQSSARTTKLWRLWQ